MIRSLEELGAAFPVDKNNLDEELIRQPQLFWEVSEGYAESASRRDQSKQVLEQARADLATQFRESALVKITEATVNEHVENHPVYIQQSQLHLQYKRETDKWNGLRESYAQRCSMLRELVNLHVTGYWGSGVDGKMIQTYKDRYRQRNED